MANESRGRQSRPPTSPPNSATMGVILVVAAVVIAILLFNAGGGGSAESDDSGTAADKATGGTTTTSSIPVIVTTPPAQIVVVVGNGSGTTGKAKTAAEKLTLAGYTNISYVPSATVPNTLVYFAPGFDLDAGALATLLKLPPDRVQPMPPTTPLEEQAPQASIVLIIGPDVNPDDAAFAVTTAPTN